MCLTNLAATLYYGQLEYSIRKPAIHADTTQQKKELENGQNMLVTSPLRLNDLKVLVIGKLRHLRERRPAGTIRSECPRSSKHHPGGCTSIAVLNCYCSRKDPTDGTDNRYKIIMNCQANRWAVWIFREGLFPADGLQPAWTKRPEITLRVKIRLYYNFPSQSGDVNRTRLPA